MKNLTYLLLLFVCLGARAQNITLKGQASVPGAVVTLIRNPDSAVVKTAVTEGNGLFNLTDIKTGRYRLAIRSVGFKSYITNWMNLTRDTSLALIQLDADTKELNTVTINSSKPLVEVRADKTVFNVQNSLSSTGTNGFDLLRKAPGVIVDNQDNLVVDGKTGVSIYIDGRLSLLTGADLVNYLKGLQSADVEAVEIITQPSSKYDAAGNAGIINLKLKKNKNYGTNGTLATGYAQGVFGKSNTSLSLNNRTAKTNIYGSYSNLIGTNRRFINLYRIQSGEIYDAQSATVSDDQNHNLRAGLDYFISKEKTFGVVVNGNFTNNDINTLTRTPIITQANGQTQQVLLATGQAAGSNRNLGTNLNYRFADTSGHEFNLDGDIGRYTADRNDLQPNTYYNATETQAIRQSTFRMVTPVNIYLFSLNADLAQRLGKGNLAYGLKSSLVKTDNTFRFYDINSGSEQFNSNRSNIFSYRENINAAYVNYSRNWKRTTLQLGVRAEQTNSSGELSSTQALADDQVKRNYLDLFPSGGITYSVNTTNKLGLLYSRRVERPNYRSLNPFEVNTDELSYSKGNPFLQPQYTQNIKLTHTYKYTLNTSVSYSYITNFIAQITDTVGGNRNFISPQNIANVKILNIGASYPFSVTNWWNVFASLNAFRTSYSSGNSKFTAVTKNTLSLYGQNSIKLPEKFAFEVSGWFSTPSVWGGTYQGRTMGSLDLALQKLFAGNRLSARVGVTDLLYTSNWAGQTQYGALYIRGNGGYETRQYKVNLSYNFGRSEIKESRKRNSAAEDEKGRIGN